MRVFWSEFERKAHLQGFLLRLEADPLVLSPAWVRNNWWAAQAGFADDRRRRYATPAELQSIFEQLKVRAYTLMQTQQLEGRTLAEQVQALEAELTALKTRLQSYERQTGRSVFDMLDTAVRGYTKPQPKTERLAQPQTPPVVCKTIVVIGGVHEKHRADFDQYGGRFNIHWLEPRMHDADIKRKASGRPVILLKQGVNGNVLNLVRNCAHRAFEVNGLQRLHQLLDEGHVK